MNLNLIPLQGSAGSGGMQLAMIVVLIVIFYFFMIRPQQKKQKEIRKFRESLDKGSKIITAGGIHGTIQQVKETTFLVQIADGVRIQVDKNSVYPAGTDTVEVQQNSEQLKK